MSEKNKIGYEELISIIVPVYNVESYLRKCLDSIRNQIYTNFEVILIDDGSADESLKICNEYAQKDKRFIVLSQANKGVSSARNKGLSVAKGKYISFVDSDDTIHPNYLQVLYNNIKRESADMSVCRWLGSDQVPPKDKTETQVWNQEETFYEYFVKRQMDGSVYAKMYKRECIADISFDVNLRIGEDQIFVIQAIERCKRIVFQDISLYTYLIRNTSAMKSILDSRYWDAVYRAEWLVKEAESKLPKLQGLFRKEELNIYVVMVIRHIKEGTEDSKEIVDEVLPRIKQSKSREFYCYSGPYETVRYFIVKYFTPIAGCFIRLKKKLTR